MLRCTLTLVFKILINVNLSLIVLYYSFISTTNNTLSIMQGIVLLQRGFFEHEGLLKAGQVFAVSAHVFTAFIAITHLLACLVIVTSILVAA